jgi:hypothetical protein
MIADNPLISSQSREQHEGNAEADDNQANGYDKLAGELKADLDEAGL